MASRINVIKDKCIGCGVCVNVCPVSAISLNASNCAEINDVCNLCGACITECSVQAIVKESLNINKIADLDVKHLIDCHDIWVVAEIREGKIATCTFELLGEARRLVKGTNYNVAAVLLCNEANSFERDLIAAGADKVYSVNNKMFRRFTDGPYKETICRLVKEEKPLAILFSATAMGRSLAPRLAASLHTGLSADCTELELHPNGILIQTRPAFGGNLFASIICPRTYPQMATVRPKVMRPMLPDYDRIGHIINKDNLAVNEGELVTTIVEYIAQENEVSVDDAEVVVTAGFGASTSEGLKLVEELALVLGGAVGASRKVVDAGLINYEHQVGQTGKTIGPKLYIACGVSGAIQHAVGMNSSKKIIAINIDADAPIFHFADIGVVANLYEFLPKLIKAVKENKKINLQ